MDIENEELKDFEDMAKEKLKLSFDEIFNVIDTFVKDELHSENISIALKKMILLKNQEKLSKK